MPEIKINKNLTTYKFLIALSIVLVLTIGIGFILTQINLSKPQKDVDKIANAVIKPVSAKELYPMFTCPCCGKSIEAECCGMASERKAYIDGLTDKEISKDDAIMSYVKKYGLNSFIDKEQQKEFKKKLTQEAPENRPIISVSPESYDFGNVSQSKGEVNHLFEIVNSGKSALIINKLETSCGCTSASVVYKGQEGPRFSMPGHGRKNSDNWQVVIPPEEKAQLKVYYNPNVHKNFRGAAVREIYVFSNDPIDFETKVRIELNQVD